MYSRDIQKLTSYLKIGGFSCSILAVSPAILAYEVADLGRSNINANLEAFAGVFHSEHGYDQFGNIEGGNFDWQEGYLKYGLELAPKSFDDGGFYGQINLVTTATEGDGDAAGFTMGDERRTDIEDAYLGYRHDRVMVGGRPWGFDISTGRQVVQLGDGFIVASDAVNFGSGLGDDFNRGGAYYLAGRRAFDNTFMLKASNETWQGRLGWLESDNKAQAYTELGMAALQRSHSYGLVELAYIHGLDVEEALATPFQLEREDMDVYSLRFEQALGNESLSLRGEYAYQTKSTDEDAWYLEPAYTFTGTPWQPVLSVRYSRFSENWDPLFYGFTRGFGTWFQGEVAANYAGPFNSNAEVWHLGLTVQPAETLTIGALAFDFETLETGNQPDMSGQELDLYAEWFPTQNFYVAPLVGLYRPEKAASDGGTQLGSDDTNLYAQLLFGVFF